MWNSKQVSEKAEAVVRKCSVKTAFLEILQNSQENTCARDYFLIKLQAEACNFNKKETLAQVFSCRFCETSIEHLFSQNTAGGCFWISKKMLLQAFSDTAKIEHMIYKKKHKKMHCKRFEALLHFRTPPPTPAPFCYWWLIMKKRGWMLYRSPNPNPRGVWMCNSARFEHIVIVSSAVKFLTKIVYGTSSSSIDSNEFFIWFCFTFHYSWMVGRSK